MRALATARCTLFSRGLKCRSRSVHSFSTIAPLGVDPGTIGGLASFEGPVGVGEVTAVPLRVFLDPSGSCTAIFWMASAARLQISWPSACAASMNFLNLLSGEQTNRGHSNASTSWGMAARLSLEFLPILCLLVFERSSLALVAWRSRLSALRSPPASAVTAPSSSPFTIGVMACSAACAAFTHSTRLGLVASHLPFKSPIAFSSSWSLLWTVGRDSGDCASLVFNAARCD